MEDLQGILEKINRDGVEKAEATAKKIIADAQTKANAIVKDAQAQAEAAKKEAELSAQDYAARAAETVRQSARDTILKIESSIRTKLEELLLKNVDRALADDATASALVLDAIKGLVGPGEITCGAKLAASLNAQLAALGSFTVVMDETFGTGFTVKTDGGRVESAFTPETIAEELAKRLRPDLAALLK